MARRSRKLALSVDAERDIDDLWDYLALEASADIAEKTVREIDRKCRLLTQHPFLGRPRDSLISGLRSILVHPHTVFYRITPVTIEIVRVLHQRRDIEAIFADDTEG
jgi:toxin ParE1/3/4